MLPNDHTSLIKITYVVADILVTSFLWGNFSQYETRKRRELSIFNSVDEKKKEKKGYVILYVEVTARFNTIESS